MKLTECLDAIEQAFRSEKRLWASYEAAGISVRASELLTLARDAERARMARCLELRSKLIALDGIADRAERRRGTADVKP